VCLRLHDWKNSQNCIKRKTKSIRISNYRLQPVRRPLLGRPGPESLRRALLVPQRLLLPPGLLGRPELPRERRPLGLLARHPQPELAALARPRGYLSFLSMVGFSFSYSISNSIIIPQKHAW